MNYTFFANYSSPCSIPVRQRRRVAEAVGQGVSPGYGGDEGSGELNDPAAARHGRRVATCNWQPARPARRGHFPDESAVSVRRSHGAAWVIRSGVMSMRRMNPAAPVRILPRAATILIKMY
ncbi:MAG: hypothetical protein KGJ32_00165 [Xanthomonadaceae bacterium]|nr:hypothetical protein [Xanthomonadaceae bacterium]